MICRDIGPNDASIMLIGEAPGAHEEREGLPFIGQSGALLKQICYAAGLDYKNCYVTNVSPIRPPNNKFEYFYEDRKKNVPKDALRKNWFDLAEKIKAISPKVVVCLGEEPLRAVTNHRGITAWRGTRIEAFDTKIIPTYHPAAILREYSLRVVTEMDFRKAVREANGLHYDPPNIITAPILDQVVLWINEAIQNGSTIAFDIETDLPLIRCIALAQRRESIIGEKTCIEAICIPFYRLINSGDVSFTSTNGILKANAVSDINYWSEPDEDTVLHLLSEVLENEKIQKIGQNSLSFDSPIIKDQWGIETRNHWMDLMHAWHLLYPTIGVRMKDESAQSGRKGLKFISSILTDHPNYWTLHDPKVDQSEWMYNAMDAVVTLESGEKVYKELLE